MDPYTDFKKAIQEHVLISRKGGAHIISRESEHVTSEWLFDFRALMLQPKWLNRYAEIFWEKHASQYPFQVAGMETAGIALVAAIVMKGVERGTPVNGFFIRKSRKRQGLMKMIEGTLTDDPVILVDDLMNSGQTIGKQIEIISSIGKKVSDVFVFIVYREKEAYAFITDKNIRFSSLFTLEDFGLPLEKTIAPEIPKDSFETLWHFAPPKPSFQNIVQKSAPVLDATRLYYGDDAGIFRALDQETGAVVWEKSTGKYNLGRGILSSPALHNGVVYFGAYDGNVYALDTETGTIRWQYDESDWVGSSPAIVPELDLLFIGLEFGLFNKRGGIAAISLTTGKQIWTDRTSSLTHGSPLYIPEEEMVVIGSNDGVVYAYAAKTGVLKWRYQTGGDIKTTFAYDKKRKLLIFGSMDATCYALSLQTGLPVFARQTSGGIYSVPLIQDDTVYIASLDKNLYAIDLDTWEDRWVFETHGRIFSSPTFFEDSLWIGSNDGRLYEINPADGTLRNFFQATERVTNKIAYNPKTKRFFVPTCANEVYCIKRKSNT